MDLVPVVFMLGGFILLWVASVCFEVMFKDDTLSVMVMSCVLGFVVTFIGFAVIAVSVLVMLGHNVVLILSSL